jgi:hypothetical protein
MHQPVIPAQGFGKLFLIFVRVATKSELRFTANALACLFSKSFFREYPVHFIEMRVADILSNAKPIQA